MSTGAPSLETQILSGVRRRTIVMLRYPARTASEQSRNGHTDHHRHTQGRRNPDCLDGGHFRR